MLVAGPVEAEVGVLMMMAAAEVVAVGRILPKGKEIPGAVEVAGLLMVVVEMMMMMIPGAVEVAGLLLHRLMMTMEVADLHILQGTAIGLVEAAGPVVMRRRMAVERILP
jgi:hypothetical protein